MAEWVCEQCQRRFTRVRSGDRAIRFCSQVCYHSWRKATNVTTGQFVRGIVPWNKDVKGLHLSPDTEFKKGQTSITHLPIGSVRIRHSRHNGHRAFVKIAEPNVWRLRCRVVWEEHYGPLPRGLLIHHIDRNTLNDEVQNLAGINRAWHLKEHRHEIETGKRAALSRKRNTRRNDEVV